MTASGSTSTKAFLLQFLTDTKNSVNELKNLGSQLAQITGAYLTLKHVLGNIVSSFDEVDAYVRRSTDIFAWHNISLTESMAQYSNLSTGIHDSIGAYAELIKIQGVTEKSLTDLAVQSRELSIVLNRSTESIAKSMREVSVGLGLTNTELSTFITNMSMLETQTGTTSDLLAQFAIQGGALAKAFGGSAESALAVAPAFERAAGSAQGAMQMFSMMNQSVSTLGQSTAMLPEFFHKSAQAMLTDPVRAVQILQEGYQSLTANQRQMMVLSGQITPVMMQHFENLSKMTDFVDENTRALSDQANAGETLEQVFKRVVDTFSVQVSEMWKDVKDLARDVGVVLVPILTTIVQSARVVLQAIKGLPSEFKAVSGAVLGLAVGFGSVLIIGQKVVALFGMIKGSVAAAAGAGALAPLLVAFGKIALIVGAVVGAILILKPLLIIVWDMFTSFLSGIAEGFEPFLKGWRETWESLKALFQSLTGVDEHVSKNYESFKSLGEIVGWAVGKVLELARAGIDMGVYLTAHLADLAFNISRAFNYISDSWDDLWADAVASFTQYSGTILQKFFEFLDKIGLGGRVSDEARHTADLMGRAMDIRQDERESNKALRALRDQEKAAKDLAGAMNEVADSSAKAATHTKDVTKSFLESLEQQGEFQRDYERDISREVHVSENRNVRVMDNNDMPREVRVSAMNMTTPIPYIPPSPASASPTRGESAGESVQPIQIVLDDYILGQALVKLNRQGRVLGYQEPGGPRNGIR